MKTHPESMFVYADSRVTYNEDDKIPRVTYYEYVPVEVYTDLKTRLEKAEYSANGFESLYDASHAENESLKAQLQTQTENMQELLGFVEMVANAPHFEQLPGDLVEQAQDLIGRITRWPLNATNQKTSRSARNR